MRANFFGATYSIAWDSAVSVGYDSLVGGWFVTWTEETGNPRADYYRSSMAATRLAKWLSRLRNTEVVQHLDEVIDDLRELGDL